MKYDPRLQTRLADCLERMIEQHPAFRFKPIGAPHSSARALQDTEVALEDEAKELIRLARERS